VLVEDGMLISGIICKKTIGASAGSLLHVVFMEMGFEVSKNMHICLCRNWHYDNAYKCGLQNV
jgi:hypothetical protein